MYELDKGYYSSASKKRSPTLRKSKSRNMTADREPIDSEFQWIRITSIIFGITFKECSSSFPFFASSSWDTFNLLLALVTSAISYSSLHFIDFTTQMLYLYYAYVTLGITIRVSLMMKRTKVYLVMSDICIIYRQFQIDARKCLLLIKYVILVFFGMIISVSVILIFYFYKEFNNNINFSLMGFDIPVSIRTYALNIIRISLILSCISSTAYISIALILCCNFYIAAENILKGYGQKITLISKATVLSQRFLIWSISSYKRMLKIFKDIDSSISSPCFLLYGSSVCCFLNMLAITFSSFEFSSDIVESSQLSVSVLLAFAIFFSLTSTGSRANGGHEHLKMALLESAENTFSRNFDTHSIEVIKILTGCINELKPCFTAGDMFIIQKSIILTTAGALVTYGVLLFQESQNK